MSKLTRAYREHRAVVLTLNEIERLTARGYSWATAFNRARKAVGYTAGLSSPPHVAQDLNVVGLRVRREKRSQERRIAELRRGDWRKP